METLGIDLAAEPKNTAVAWVQWDGDHARVTDLYSGATDDELVRGMTAASKSGIDCPLGWPREFIRFISLHQEEHVDIAPGSVPSEWRRRLAYRVTDLHVKKTVPGIQGLSVSSDRIGVTTMRCAAILSQLAAVGETVRRDGSGPVVEVYPAASLVRWGFNHKGYKGNKGTVRRGHLVDELLERAEWLDLDGYESTCRASDDALDALLASLTARASAVRLTEPVPIEARAAAEIEGWIALPAVGTNIASLLRGR